MTVQASPYKATYTYNGVGSATVFPFAFLIFQAADLVVQKVDAAGNLSTLVQGADYTISGVLYPNGGNVTLNVALTSGQSVVLFRDPAVAQLTSLAEGSAYSASAVMNAMDYIVMELQAVKDRALRSLRAPANETPTEAAFTWPSAAQRANKVAAWDSAGNPIAGATPSAGIVSSAMQPFAAAATLQDGRDVLGMQYICLEDFGGAADYGVTDNTPAYNAALAYAFAHQTRTILRLKSGVYYFNTRPNACTSPGFIIEGNGISTTGMSRNYSAASDDEGFIEFDGVNGCGLRNLSIVSATGTSLGTLVKYYCQSVGVGAGYGIIDNVYFSYGSLNGHSHCLLADGLTNNQAGGQGQRDLRVSRCLFFDPTGGVKTAVEIRNGVNTYFSNNWINGTVYITGGGSALVNSNTVCFVNNRISLNFTVDNSTYVFSTGGICSGNVSFAATAISCSWIGAVSGTTTNSSTTTSIIAQNNGAVLVKGSDAAGALQLPQGTDKTTGIGFVDGWLHRISAARARWGDGASAATVGGRGFEVNGAGTTVLTVRDSTDLAEFMVYVASAGVILGTVSNHTLTLRTANNDRASIDTLGNFFLGTAALASNATNGFPSIPTCAGAPSGTPTLKTGLAPMVYDTTNNKLWVYNGAAWKGVVLA